MRSGVHIFTALQALVLIRLIHRFARGLLHPPIRLHGPIERAVQRVSIVIPVLNEAERLEPCLRGVVGQIGNIAEIVVVDGGSTDGTQDLVRRYSGIDERVCLVDAPPRPHDWNGKAWGLQTGLENVSDDSFWIVTIDADVRCSPQAVAMSVALAGARRFSMLSLATSQVTSTAGLAWLHPSMLATLVYRHGVPGSIPATLADVQANGQFTVFRRSELDSVGGFSTVRGSICEDITLAREFHVAGNPVGFVESGQIVQVEMHRDGWDCWHNWPRSLSLRDRFTRWSSLLRLSEAALAQAMPLPLLIASIVTGTAPRAFIAVNVALLFSRIGVLAGTRRAYVNPSWSYWLSPLVDLPVYGAILVAMGRRDHSWRGLRLVTPDFVAHSVER